MKSNRTMMTPIWNENGCHMCMEKNGRYYIGRASQGDESKIEIVPAEKTAVDTLTKGLTKNQRRWTIHGPPVERRQNIQWATILFFNRFDR